MNNALLASLANKAITGCVGNTSQVAGVGEIPEVARLVLGLPDLLVNAWRPHMAAGWLEVEGVFCHATPYAHWDDPESKATPPRKRRPELCDLLIVVETGATQPGRVRDWAFLVQAKDGNGGAISIEKGRPAAQRYMYANWPTFKLVGRPLPPLIGVNIAPSTPGACSGSRYACVDVTQGTWSFESGQAPSISPFGKLDDYAGTVQTTRSLGDELVAALTGQAGAPCFGKWGSLVRHLQLLAIARLFSEKSPSAVKPQMVGGPPLSHACRAATFVGRWEPPASAQPLAVNTRVPYSLLEHGGSVASTIAKGQLLAPQYGFGLLTIRTRNLKFAEE